MDAIFLAAACPVRTGQSVLDMGCGVGTAGLSILARVEGVSLVGIEIQDDHVALARENAAVNGYQDCSEFIASDIRQFSGSAFDHVICNPPYLKVGTYTETKTPAKALAMGGEITFAQWISVAFDHIAGQGSLTMVHRADHIDQILQAFGKRFGGVEIIPLWPRAGEAAKRVIVRGYKHRRSPATMHAGVVLHEGEYYTKAAEQILREMKALV